MSLVESESTGILERLGATVTPTSLTLTDPNLPLSDYESLCAFVGRVNRSCAWWTGDLLLAGEKLYGDDFVQAADAFGLAVHTLQNRLTTCRKVPPSVRRPGVPFSHHAEVTMLPPNDQRRLLKVADEEGLTKEQLRQRVQAERNGEVIEAPRVCRCCGRALAERE